MCSRKFCFFFAVSSLSIAFPYVSQICSIDFSRCFPWCFHMFPRFFPHFSPHLSHLFPWSAQAQAQLVQGQGSRGGCTSCQARLTRRRPPGAPSGHEKHSFFWNKNGDGTDGTTEFLTTSPSKTKDKKPSLGRTWESTMFFVRADVCAGESWEVGAWI